MMKSNKCDKLRKRETKLLNREEQKELSSSIASEAPKLATTTIQMPIGKGGVAPKQSQNKSGSITLKHQMFSRNKQGKKKEKANNTQNDNSKQMNAKINVEGNTDKANLKMNNQKKKTEKFSDYTKSQHKDKKSNTQAIITSKDIKPAMVELRFNLEQGGDGSAATKQQRQSAGNTSVSKKSSLAPKATPKVTPKKTPQATNIPTSNSKKQVNIKIENGGKPKMPVKRPAVQKKLNLQQKRLKLANHHAQKNDDKKNVDTDSDTDSIGYIEKLFPGYLPHGTNYNGEQESVDDEYDSMTCSDDEHEYHPFNDRNEYYSSDISTTEIDTDDLSSEEKCAGSSPECFSEDNRDEFSFYESSSDEDYKPPSDMLEDLVIYKGHATKYDIPKDEPVLLHSDTEESHLVDVTETTVVRTIQQPEAYNLDALNKLNEMFEKVTINVAAAENNVGTVDYGSPASCPELVPIIESDFEFSLPSDDDFYELCSDQDSHVSDINEKYMESENSSTDNEDTQNYMKNMEVTVYKDDKNSSIKPPIEFDDNDMVRTIPTAKEDDFPDLNIDENGKYEIIDVPMKKAKKSKKKLSKASTKISQDSFKSAVDFENPSTYDDSNSIDEAELSHSNSTDLEKMPTTEKSTTNRNIFCNGINSNDVLVLLKDEFYIYGTIRLTLVYGTAEVYGYLPEEGKSVEIFSPRGCSMVQITPKLREAGCKYDLECALKQYDETFTHANLKEIIENYTPGKDAVLLLQRNDRSKKLVSNFKKFMSESVFPNMKSFPTDRPNYASEYVLQCFINNDSDRGFQISPEWLNINLCDQTKMLITGGKSVGKSTLLRYLVNKSLKQFPQILIIDLDIGQSELFIPQTISCTVVTEPLLGPGFFLKLQPDKAFMVGHVNVALCAETYMRAVKELLEFCHSQLEYANMPWLINTMGYNKGFGLELIACVADYVRPTDIVQLMSNKKMNNFGEPLLRNNLKIFPRIIFGAEEFKSDESAVEPPCQLRILSLAVKQQSRFQKDWEMSAKDLRYAMLVARLSGALVGNADWLTDCKPLSAPLNSIHLVNMVTNEGTREELLAAVETNLVYLCQMGNDSNGPLECFGIGIVRCVDYKENQVYLLPATFYDRLNNVNCLALGEMPLPNSLFINQGPKVRGTAPFVYRTVDESASKAVKQIFHRPADFLNGVQREF